MERFHIQFPTQSSSLKIALDVSQTCVEVGGCGWIAKQVADAIIKLPDANNEILLYHHFGKWINATTEQGYKSELPHVQSPLLDFTPDEANQLWNFEKCRSSDLPGSPDIVHSHNFSAPDTGSVPLVYTVHDLAFWDIPQATTEQNRLVCQDGVLQALKNASGFIFPSEFTKSRFIELFGDIIEENGQHAAVAHWAGRYPIRKEPKPYHKDSPWIFVGSLDPRKNIRNMLHAFERYREQSKQNRQLLIAGPRGWKTDFESKQIKDLENRGWAKHLGYVDDTLLEKIYHDAFALVWPSFYEGFGLPVVEAMSQGTPVITSKQTSLPEVGGAAAIYCDPNSVDSIVDAMLRLEKNEDQYVTISKDSLQQSAQFSWQNTALQLLEFYQQVLNSSHPSSL